MKPVLVIIVAVGLTLAFTDATHAAPASHDHWEDSLTAVMTYSRAQRLPLEPLENKIREGRAKNRTAAQIFPVVKARQKLLLQLRDNQIGFNTPEYTKQLFDLERSNTPGTKTAGQQVLPSSRHIETAATTKKTSVIKSDLPNIVSDKKNPDATITSGNNNANRQIRKADQKAEKFVRKAEFRAEQRMKTVEKRIRKQEMHRYGAGK